MTYTKNDKKARENLGPVKIVTATKKITNDQAMKITKSSEPNQSVTAILHASNYIPSLLKNLRIRSTQTAKVKI